jgi:6-phosphogluconate dehydrogenase
MERQADIGLIGLAVMGQNLVLNMNDHGYAVAVYNRTTEKTKQFIAGPASGRDGMYGTDTIEELVRRLKSPKKIMLMVKAGAAVDTLINTLLPLLEPGDIVIDGGNSHFPDTVRRTADLKEKGVLFVGTGVSGGEEGARKGPSLMPGGNPEAWPFIRGIFTDIAAKTADGEACCDWVGEDGAGHYVKMVHNGIEYGDIQLISEAYQLLKDLLGLSYPRMAEIFAHWNAGELESYLIEITADILTVRDKDGTPLAEHILDTAGQKGTGKWTAINSLETGVPVTLIGEAVFARYLSALKEERTAASEILRGPAKSYSGETGPFIEDIRQALYAAKIISYTQGYMLMRQAAKEYSWNLNYGGIALMWRGGCIIRSAFLRDIKAAFDKNPELPNLLIDEYFRDVIHRTQQSLRNVVMQAAAFGVPVPALSAALSFYDGYRSKRLPANLLQAQRDYFGAHMYERTDKPRGSFYHTDWTGDGGETARS